jgi:hypothetical protein
MNSLLFIRNPWLLLASTILPVFYCGLNPPDAGNSSQVGNPALAGVVYNQNGTRAANAKVRIARWNTSPQDSNVVADSTVTNDTGGYAIDSLAADTFNLLASSGSFLGYKDSIDVKSDTTTLAPPCTLKATGSVSGVVRLEPGDNSTNVYILFMGTNTFVTPNDSIGNFIAANLAEGRYKVKIITTLPDYDPMDTSFTITAGVDAVLPDTLRLHYTGIPVARGLRIVYDTMKQIVTLIWDKPTTGVPLSGYNIYRKHQDSTQILLRGNWQDTVYHDSTGIQDIMYEYRVAAVDTNTSEGTRSGGVNVTVVSAFTIVDSIANGSGTNYGQFGYLVHAVMDSSKNFYIIDTKNKWLQKIDSTGQFVFKFASLQYPRGITIDDLNIALYISDSQRRLIIKLTLGGDTINSWQPVNVPSGMIYNAGKLYVALPDTGIKVYDSVGNEIVFYNYPFKRHNSDNINFCLDPNGKIYVADAENILELDTSSGILTPIYSIINFDQNQDPDIEFVDDSTIILATRGAPVPYQSRLYFIDKKKGVQKGIWKSNEAITDMVYSTIQHRMFVFTSSGKILFCQLNL